MRIGASDSECVSASTSVSDSAWISAYVCGFGWAVTFPQNLKRARNGEAPYVWIQIWSITNAGKTIYRASEFSMCKSDLLYHVG